MMSLDALKGVAEDGDVEVDKGNKGADFDFEGELQSSTSAFEALERDFQEVSISAIVACHLYPLLSSLRLECGVWRCATLSHFIAML